MIKVENIETFGWEGALRGMRNPKNSWDLSDSYIIESCVMLGSNDLKLMKTLCKGGSEHRKYLRMIHVQMDITAPLYWWKEFDTYKVGTVANSCSTMHKIQAKEFTLEDFSVEHLNAGVIEKLFKTTIDYLNFYRDLYNQNKVKDDWWQMIQILPTSYNQKRTIDMNYENVLNIIHQRTGHKLDEWHELIDILKGLPYVNKLLDV